MDADDTNATRRLFREWRIRKMQDLEELGLDDLDINPFLVELLGLRSPDDIIDFYVDQFVSRSIVTGFGSLLENIGALKGSKPKVKDIDFLIKRGQKEFYVSMKSGPKGFTGPALNKTLATFKRLRRSSRRRRGVIGIAYGREGRLSEIWGNEARQADKLLVGRDFWEFLFRDSRAAFHLIGLARSEFEASEVGTLQALRSRIKQRVAQEWRESFGEGDGSIQRMIHASL